MAHDILIVDDERDIRLLICDILRDEGYTTREAGESDMALAALRARPPAVIVLDVWLQGSPLDGIGILEVISREYPDVPVIIISGHGTIELAVRAIKIGAYDFVEKPFQTDRLLLVVARAIEAARLRRENAELRLRAGGEVELTGDSGAINLVRNTIERVAPTGSRVLITGPPGAGKEIVARLVHRRSRRADGPFVVLNAATLAPERMEIELFGAEAGSQAPESPRKLGTFERAHGGTLFLDEVADTPIETQGKILRFLQEQAFERVGGGPRIEVDVRIVAASNRDLRAEIASGRFREDLYYRLNVVPIRIPALRERCEDIPPLARHFMTRAAETAGLPPREIGEDVMAALQACEWPGNVRQLRNLVEWLLIMAPGSARTPIRAEMLPADLAASAPPSIRRDGIAEIMSMPLREARETFEREYLTAQIARFGGNISRTAIFIGMERSALHRKLKLLGLSEGGRGASAESDTNDEPSAAEGSWR